MRVARMANPGPAPHAALFVSPSIVTPSTKVLSAIEAIKLGIRGQVVLGRLEWPRSRMNRLLERDFVLPANDVSVEFSLEALSRRIVLIRPELFERQ